EIIQDRATSKPRGFGFVELEDEGMAETAVRSLNGKLFAGRALTISWATPIRESACSDSGTQGRGGSPSSLDPELFRNGSNVAYSAGEVVPLSDPRNVSQ